MYAIDVQVAMSVAVFALHNFISIHTHYVDDIEINFEHEEEVLESRPTETLPYTAVMSAEKTQADQLRDEIAMAMWNDYQRHLRAT